SLEERDQPRRPLPPVDLLERSSARDLRLDICGRAQGHGLEQRRPAEGSPGRAGVEQQLDRIEPPDAGQDTQRRFAVARDAVEVDPRADQEREERQETDVPSHVAPVNRMDESVVAVLIGVANVRPVRDQLGDPVRVALVQSGLERLIGYWASQRTSFTKM